MISDVPIGDIMLGLLPMAVLIGATYFFLRKYYGPGSPHERQVQLDERRVRALERIADALERRG